MPLTRSTNQAQQIGETFLLTRGAVTQRLKGRNGRLDFGLVSRMLLRTRSARVRMVFCSFNASFLKFHCAVYDDTGKEHLSKVFINQKLGVSTHHQSEIIKQQF